MATAIPKAEPKIDNVFATLTNEEVMQTTLARLERTSAMDAADAVKLHTWEAALHEARAYVAKLYFELENASVGFLPPIVTCLAWSLLWHKLAHLAKPRIVAGCIVPTEKPKDDTLPAAVPHLWIEVDVPEELRGLLKQVWGEGHPRSTSTLVTDMGADLNGLRDICILGQRLATRVADEGEAADPEAARTSTPYPVRFLRPERDDTGRFVPPSGCGVPTDFETRMINWHHISEHPRDYLMWGMPSEIREHIHPRYQAWMRADPFRMEYTRISFPSRPPAALDQSGGETQ